MNGGVPEWLKGMVSKAIVAIIGCREFESHPLRLRLAEARLRRDAVRQKTATASLATKASHIINIKLPLCSNSSKRKKSQKT